MPTSGINRTARTLFIVSLLMFGFGYLMVPLYDVFCDITGLNGKTGIIIESEVTSEVDKTRWVTVEFDTNIHGDLPWEFKATELSRRVHPGEFTEVLFIAENRSKKFLSGQAIPSVAPQQASLFFNKTECFCFTRQTLGPGERREMMVRFVVGTDLPKRISTLTLSYTFLMAPREEDDTAAAQQKTGFGTPTVLTAQYGYHRSFNHLK